MHQNITSYRIAVLLLVVILFFPFFVFSQVSIDYKSVVAGNGSTSDFPTHYSYGTHGPYIAHNKIWVFYSDGEYAVWKTKQINEGGEWEDGNYVFDITRAVHFNMAFDGQYFHFIRALNGDLKYLRGKANSDGSITFDPEVIAYSDPVWKVRITEGFVLPRHFSIYVDSEESVWAAVKVGDGNERTSNFKPIALSNVAEDGSWVSRDGFPADLAPSYNIRGNGRALNIIEISQGNILYSWANDRESTSDPDHGMRARLWFDGTFGEIENTGLPYNSAASSFVVPESGVAMLNSGTAVARRNSNGSWTRVDPGGMINWTFNSFSAYNNKVRLWDYSNENIRYKESENNGESWTPIIEKWNVSDILRFSASHSHGSDGNHHSALWSEGTNPYDVVMGIEGESYAIQIPHTPLLVYPDNGSANISIDPVLIWESVETADSYTIQLSDDADMDDPLIDESGFENTELAVSLDHETEYFWRVRAANIAGESDWSEIWSFTTEIDVPEVPLLTSPDDGAMDQPVALELAWELTERAETYHLQVSKEYGFSSLFYDNDEITEKTEEIDNLDHQKEYFWRVRASNTTGTSDWSDIWSFSTVEEAPEKPVLVSPLSGAQNISVDTIFT